MFTVIRGLSEEPVPQELSKVGLELLLVIRGPTAATLVTHLVLLHMEK